MLKKETLHPITHAEDLLPNERVLESDQAIAVLSQNPTKLRCFGNRKCRAFIGFLYTFLHCVFILLSSVLVKKLSYISPGQLSLVRNAGVFVGCLPIAVYSVKNILGPPKYFCMLTFRSFLGATALYLNLLAFSYLPLAEASTILSMNPAFVSITARVYLKESCGLVQVAAVLLTIVGVMLSVHLPEVVQSGSMVMDSRHVMGIASAVGCVCILSFTMVTLRKMTDVHFSVVLIYFGFLGMLENATLTAVFASFDPPLCRSWDEWRMLLIALFGFLGHCFFTLALQSEAAGIVSVLKASVDIVASMVLQVIFFDLRPDLYQVSGAALVVVSVAMIGTRKWLLSLPDDSPKRHHLRFFLL